MNSDLMWLGLFLAWVTAVFVVGAVVWLHDRRKG